MARFPAKENPKKPALYSETYKSTYQPQGLTLTCPDHQPGLKTKTYQSTETKQMAKPKTPVCITTLNIEAIINECNCNHEINLKLRKPFLASIKLVDSIFSFGTSRTKYHRSPTDRPTLKQRPGFPPGDEKTKEAPFVQPHMAMIDLIAYKQSSIFQNYDFLITNNLHSLK